MPFEWMKKFQHEREKPADYATKTLTAYRLGMMAGGSIQGVRVEPGPNACLAAQELPVGAVYHPDEAPPLPLPACPHNRACQCIYRPVMTYEVSGEKPT